MDGVDVTIGGCPPGGFKKLVSCVATGTRYSCSCTSAVTMTLFGRAYVQMLGQPADDRSSSSQPTERAEGFKKPWWPKSDRIYVINQTSKDLGLTVQRVLPWPMPKELEVKLSGGAPGQGEVGFRLAREHVDTTAMLLQNTVGRQHNDEQNKALIPLGKECGGAIVEQRVAPGDTRYINKILVPAGWILTISNAPAV
jgi:hypothetical protein